MNATETTSTADLAQRVKTKRALKGLSLRQLAKRANVLHTAIDRLEHGKEVEASTMIAVCKALKIRI